MDNPQGAPVNQEPHITWRIKPTTLCNLRCRYCYEWDRLADGRRLALGDWVAIVGAANDHRASMERQLGRRVQLHLVVQGGEPFLLPDDYLRAVLDICRQHLGDGTRLGVLTNLTVVRDSDTGPDRAARCGRERFVGRSVGRSARHGGPAYRGARLRKPPTPPSARHFLRHQPRARRPQPAWALCDLRSSRGPGRQLALDHPDVPELDAAQRRRIHAVERRRLSSDDDPLRSLARKRSAPAGDAAAPVCRDGRRPGLARFRSGADSHCPSRLQHQRRLWNVQRGRDRRQSSGPTVRGDSEVRCVRPGLPSAPGPRSPALPIVSIRADVRQKAGHDRPHDFPEGPCPIEARLCGYIEASLRRHGMSAEELLGCADMTLDLGEATTAPGER